MPPKTPPPRRPFRALHFARNRADCKAGKHPARGSVLGVMTTTHHDDCMLDLKRQDPIAHAHALGVRQYHRGAQRTDCPFDDEPRRTAWQDGWAEAWGADD